MVIGPTGQFPDGRLNAADQGQLRYGIAADPENRVVVIKFGTPVEWLGLPPENARQLALGLLRKAQELDQLKVTVQIGDEPPTENLS